MITRDDLAFYMQDGLSEFDLAHLWAIIHEEYGNWYHAELMRALHLLLSHADLENTARLERAYPGSVAAYRAWYNNPQVFAFLSEPSTDKRS